MEAFAFTQALIRLHEEGYLENPEVHLETHVVTDEETGEIKKIWGERISEESSVLQTIWTVGKGKNNKRHEIMLMGTQGHYEVLISGEQIEILSTAHQARPTMYYIVRPQYPEDSPRHREGLAFQGTRRIVPRVL